MDNGVLCNKEMVDLLMKIKRHLKSAHNISISMSDRNLMVGLLELANLEDDLFQGMLQYLMVLAGGDWNQRYTNMSGSRKRASRPSIANKVKESILSHDVKAKVAPVPQGAKVRYYRGQPISG
jgi:hypothetical protein